MATLLATGGQRPCRRCGLDMYHPDACPFGKCRACTLDLGHPDDAPRVLGGRTSTADDLEHAYCNRGAGARLGAALRVIARHNERW